MFVIAILTLLPISRAKADARMANLAREATCRKLSYNDNSAIRQIFKSEIMPWMIIAR